MCLISEFKTPSTNSYNILCYKILISVGSELRTPYRDFLFNIGEVTTDSVEGEPSEVFNHYMIEAGYFHSYKNIDAARQSAGLIQRHSPKGTIVKVFEAQIPAGTPYFEGQFEDLCSKSLLIIKEYSD